MKENPQEFAKLMSKLITDHDFRKDFFSSSSETTNKKNLLSEFNFSEEEMNMIVNKNIVISIGESEFLFADKPEEMRNFIAPQAKHSYCC